MRLEENRGQTRAGGLAAAAVDSQEGVHWAGVAPGPVDQLGISFFVAAGRARGGQSLVLRQCTRGSGLCTIIVDGGVHSRRTVPELMGLVQEIERVQGNFGPDGHKSALDAPSKGSRHCLVLGLVAMLLVHL